MADELPPAPALQRQQTHMEIAISEFRPEAKKLLNNFVGRDTPAPQSLPHRKLQGSFFVGHTATDLDSIASAIGAAELFAGVATKASEINTETAFALDYWQFPLPPLFKEALAEDPNLPTGEPRGVCLVDHNQVTQLAEGVDCNHVIGVIDHHALQSNTIATPGPIYINIQPWGSAATIVAQMFLDSSREIRPCTAGLLLCAILSDTLNLVSPTTTEADRLMVTLLSLLADVQDVDALATKLFRAKSRMIDLLTSHQLINGDLKTFSYSHSNFRGIVAWGTVESPDVLETVGRDQDKLSELRYELRSVKHECGAALAFVSLVDIVNLRSALIICGRAEQQIAEIAFGGKVINGMLDLGSRVSRKADFIPPLSKALSGGWRLPSDAQDVDDEKFEIGSVYVDCLDGQCVTRRHRPRSQLYDYLGEDEEDDQIAHLPPADVPE